MQTVRPYITQHKPRAHHHAARCPVLSDDEFDLGRQQVLAAWGIAEPTVSTHHVRFRCVVFEEDDQQKVPPLVYARILSVNAVSLNRFVSDKAGSTTILRQTDGDVLLNKGDQLQLTPHISIVFEVASHTPPDSGALSTTRQAEVQRFAHQYRVTDRVLGTGGQATVFVAVKQSDQRQFACKVLPMPSNKASSARANATSTHPHPHEEAAARERETQLIKKRADLTREYNILKDLSHPNIITLEKVFCATYNVYILQELITGGDLLSYIDIRGTLTEPQTAVIVRQILKAVAYLHNHGIAHRDVKPENVLMTSWRDGARVVLTDFGHSRMLEPRTSAQSHAAVSRMQSVIGTYGYTAPCVI